MFDPNAMLELAHLKAERYQRNGGGGAHKIYNSSKAYDESRGIKEMSVWQRAVYECNRLWASDRDSAVSGFAWDCRWFALDKEANGDIPF